MPEAIDQRERKAALMPIKPKFVEKILSGEKTVEFRKTNFKNDIDTIIIYSSSPIKKIVAICDVKQINKKSPFTLWKQYKKVSGIKYSEYAEYYKNNAIGIALELSNVRIFISPMDLKDVVDVKQVPQSFMYVDETTVSELENQFHNSMSMTLKNKYH